MNLSPSVAAMALLSMATPGCGESCAAVGCSPHAIVTFSQDMTEAGEYRVSVVADDVSLSCTLTIPISEGEACPDDRLALVLTGKQIASGGADTEAAATKLSGLLVFGQPESVQVTLERDGVVLVEERLDPTYEDAEINGPDCGSCPEATERLTIP